MVKEIGVSGLERWSGQIQEDFLRELQGKRGYKRYNEMRLNSPVVGAMMTAIEQSVRGITWQYVSDEEDDPRVEFLEDAIKRMTYSWNDHIIEALSMLPFGYAPFEIVYERVKGRVYWRKFAFRAQDTIDRWLFDKNGGLEGFIQRGAPDYTTRKIPIDKMVLYRTRVEKNNPEGRSILRSAWIPYYYAKNIQQVEAIGIERDLAGLPVINLPQGADTNEDSSDSDASKAAKIVRNVRNDEQAGLVLPEGWVFELASTGGSRQFDTDKIVRRYESRILMSSLAQFLMLGQNSVGTQALSSDMTDFWTMSVNATADLIADTHTKFAAHKLLKMNGFEAEGVRMEHSPAGDMDIGMLGDFFQKAGDKITWMPSDEVWLRGLVRLPEATTEQIEEERERKANMLPLFPTSEMTSYAADKAPDDDERRSNENKLEWHLRRFLTGQQKRIVNEAQKD